MAKKSKITIANNKLSRVGIEWLLNFLIQISLISIKLHSSLYHNLGRKLWKKKRLFLFVPKIIFYDIMEVSAILFARFIKQILANSYQRSPMNKQDISTIIELHFEEMTDLEQEIARYFLQADTINDDLSSQQVTQKLHISQAALTRFAKKCGFKGYREFIFKYQQQKDTLSAPQQDMNPLTQRVLRSYANIREISQGLIDDEQLERVAQMIDQSERVYFFGTGSSGLVAREMKLRFMRLGVVCEALTDPDGFAWTTSIIDEKCLVFGFSLSGTTPSIIDSLLDAQDMGAKTVLFTSAPNKDTQAFTETVLVASQSQASYIQRISAQIPMLIIIDLLYAYFLEIDRESKEKIFNSYWENNRLNGYRRNTRNRKP